MDINEVRMSIVSAPQGYNLVGAFSSDLNCSVGLPAVFDKMFDITERVDQQLEPGMVFRLDNLFILTVKESSYDAPSMTMLKKSLEKLKETVQVLGIKKIAMPRICTGKNGFSWDYVFGIICETFDYTDVDILVCY